MSDPLSIAAGVVGVVTAAAQISILLTKFTKSLIGDPQQAKVVLAEVSDISVILTQLQSYLLGLESPNSSRASLLKVEKVVTIVSGCVLTFSELEKLLDELKTEGLDVLDCLKWARKQSAIMGLVQRLQNNKSSLSVILNILNGFVPHRQVLLPAWLLRFARHTITEAKNSVDQLHHLMEQGYSEISSRVRALEVLSLQKDNPSWTSKDDSESLAIIRAHRPDLSAEEIIESGRERFDFSDELQRSRVYKRNEAFRTSVISAITNSMYSLGWSFFSDLSMAEVSNISVMNLAVFEGEVFNPGRTSQTWSAQSGRVTSTDDHLDGQSTQLYKVGHGPVQADTSAAIARGHWRASTQTQERSLSWTRSPLPRLHPLERRRIRPLWEQHLGDEESTRNAEILDPTSTLSPADLSDPLSPPQPQTSSSSQSDEGVEDGESYVEQDEAAYPGKGCGEVCSIGRHTTFQLSRPLPQIGELTIATCTQIPEEGKALELGTPLLR